MRYKKVRKRVRDYKIEVEIGVESERVRNRYSYVEKLRSRTTFERLISRGSVREIPFETLL